MAQSADQSAAQKRSAQASQGVTGLQASDLACRRGGRLLFAGLSFALRPGEALLLSGPNGAGKTSLLRLLAGLLPWDGGSLSFEGGDRDQPLSEQIHYVGHANGVKTSLSVAENLLFWADFYAGGVSQDRLGAALETFGLGAIAALPAGLLSAGQKRKLALCRLLVAERPLWLLDEPSVSLDAASTKLLAKTITGHLHRGGMAIVASHTPLSLRFAHRLELGHAHLGQAHPSQAPLGDQFYAYEAEA